MIDSDIPNVIPHLNELLNTWRSQNYEFTDGQRVEYDILLSTRRDRVKQLYEQGRVCKSNSNRSKEIS